MSNLIDFRKIPVRRDREFEDLVKLFVSNKNSDSDDSGNYIFNTIKEFMVFAAMVGFEFDRFEPIKAQSETISIILETYMTTDDDAYIYLIALSKEPTLDILKNDNLKKAVEYFEGYCNAGLLIIKEWKDNNYLGEIIDAEFIFKKALAHIVDNS